MGLGRIRFCLIAGALLCAAAACNNDKLTAGKKAVGQGAIEGKVCAPSGNLWLAGADVWVDQGGAQDATTTDDQGHFLLGGVDAGQQTLHVQKGSFSTQQQVAVVAGQTTQLPTPACVNGTIHVAVVTGNDKIESILAGAGITDVTLYGSNTGAAGTMQDLLGNPTLMATYKIIFIDCGDFQKTTFTGTGDVANLAAYVAAGGSLYASDWAYDWIAQAFPGKVDFYGNDSTLQAARAGNQGNVTGNVVDSALATALGHSTLAIDYAYGKWGVAQSVASGGKVLVTGDVQITDPTTNATSTLTGAPLAVEFKVGGNGGSVVYTSFHNESQSTQDMDTALAYMVFQL